jgi:hypothetical protein
VNKFLFHHLPRLKSLRIDADWNTLKSLVEFGQNLVHLHIYCRESLDQTEEDIRDLFQKFPKLECLHLNFDWQHGLRCCWKLIASLKFNFLVIHEAYVIELLTRGSIICKHFR